MHMQSNVFCIHALPLSSSQKAEPHTCEETRLIFGVYPALNTLNQQRPSDSRDTVGLSSSHQRAEWTDKHLCLGRCSGTQYIIIAFICLCWGTSQTKTLGPACRWVLAARFFGSRLVCTPSFDS